MRKMLTLVALAVLLASPAVASNGWYEGTGTSDPIATLQPRGGSRTNAAYFHIDSTATVGSFSKALSAPLASQVEVLLIPDHNQVASSSTCEVRIWATAAAGGTQITTASGLPQLSADTDGDGVQNDETLDGMTENRRGLAFVGVPGITVEIVALPGAGEQCLLFVRGSF
jgi:hypothetical protein